MKVATNGFFLRGDEVLLAMKKRGFGMGKWNGVGGKKEESETLEACEVREIKEEVGVVVKPSDLVKVAHLLFSFENNPTWDHDVTVYFISNWEGEITESDELVPKWFPKSALPFNKMWLEDEAWLSLVLAGKKIEGRVKFNSDATAVIEKELTEI